MAYLPPLSRRYRSAATASCFLQVAARTAATVKVIGDDESGQLSAGVLYCSTLGPYCSTPASRWGRCLSMSSTSSSHRSSTFTRRPGPPLSSTRSAQTRDVRELGDQPRGGIVTFTVDGIPAQKVQRQLSDQRHQRERLARRLRPALTFRAEACPTSSAPLPTTTTPTTSWAGSSAHSRPPSEATRRATQLLGGSAAPDATQRSGSALASNSARCTARRDVPWPIWVRQLNPSATTAVSSAASRTAGSRTRSPTAFDKA
jgi:hypothetical protein